MKRIILVIFLFHLLSHFNHAEGMSESFLLFKDKKENQDKFDSERLKGIQEALQEKLPEPRNNPYPKPKYVYGGYTTRGVGYTRSYASIGALFAPDFQRGKVLPMIDVRAHRLNNATYAGNFGVGARYIPNSKCQIFGANAFYDFRQTPIAFYNQIGLGFEVYGEKWGLHLNGSMPVGYPKHAKKHVFDDFIGDFVMICRLTEFPFKNANLSVVLPIVESGPFLLMAEVSPYYVSAKHFKLNSWGISFGLRPQIKDYLFLSLSVSHDSVFETIYKAQIILSLPLYRFSSSKNRKGPCRLTNRQIYQRIERNEIIMLDKFCCWKSNF